jgi:16S rRNA (adenine1518-N6/adenine1519-N6)-dimethyltransferase
MKKPRLGQNYLIDDNIAHKIVCHAGISNDQHVLEIGPGKGILTNLLLEKAKSLTAIEIDSGLCSTLTNRFKAYENFKLIQTDALKYNYSGLRNQCQVVSNLPYYAATHILKRLIHYREYFTQITVMLQKEVVDRLVAIPGTRDYGSLSVFVQFYCEVERLIEVSKEAFSPKPKIDSSVIKLTPLTTPRVQVDNLKTFFSVVNASFLHKRKMLKNNLTGWESLFKNKNEKTELGGINLSRRGETLSIQDFAIISNHINSLDG